MSASEPESPEVVTQPVADIRPVVAGPAGNRSLWIFAAVLLLGGLLLFRALESRREAITAPTTFAGADTGRGTIAPPPELAIPPQPVQAWPYDQGWQPPVVLHPVAPATTPEAAAPARLTRVVPPTYTPPSYAPPSLPTPAGPANYQNGWTPPASASPAGPNGPGARPGAPDAPGAQNGKDRVEARRFSNPATTVPRGTVLQAVLESALDSTRGGFARAIVSRDIYSFDGSRVLIQRGSRIIGEYKSDVTLGQKRILIQWQRLMRPDGVMIDLDSPSADPLGRAGVAGSVNSHFFERFAGAILQSSLDIGVQLAARAASHDTVVLALPGSVQQAGQTLQPERIPPTVKVRQGSSVSVFVARDLDFTGF